MAVSFNQMVNQYPYDPFNDPYGRERYEYEQMRKMQGLQQAAEMKQTNDVPKQKTVKPAEPEFNLVLLTGDDE